MPGTDYYRLTVVASCDQRVCVGPSGMNVTATFPTISSSDGPDESLSAHFGRARGPSCDRAHRALPDQIRVEAVAY